MIATFSVCGVLYDFNTYFTSNLMFSSSLYLSSAFQLNVCCFITFPLLFWVQHLRSFMFCTVFCSGHSYSLYYLSCCFSHCLHYCFSDICLFIGCLLYLYYFLLLYYITAYVCLLKTFTSDSM